MSINELLWSAVLKYNQCIIGIKRSIVCHEYIPHTITQPTLPPRCLAYKSGTQCAFQALTCCAFRKTFLLTTDVKSGDLDYCCSTVWPLSLTSFINKLFLPTELALTECFCFSYQFLWNVSGKFQNVSSCKNIKMNVDINWSFWGVLAWMYAMHCSHVIGRFVSRYKGVANKVASECMILLKELYPVYM